MSRGTMKAGSNLEREIDEELGTARPDGDEVGDWAANFGAHELEEADGEGGQAWEGAGDVTTDDVGSELEGGDLVIDADAWQGEVEGDDAELALPDVDGFAERFHELAVRSREGDEDALAEADSLLREMEAEYFLGGVLKRVGSGIAKVAKQLPQAKLVQGLAKVAGGALRGNLLSLAQAALSSHPAIAAAMPALRALGFGKLAGGGPDAWKNFAGAAKSAFTNLRGNFAKAGRDAVAATRLAQRSFEQAMDEAKSRGAGSAGRAPLRVVTLRPGERLLVRVKP